MNFSRPLALACAMLLCAIAAPAGRAADPPADPDAQALIVKGVSIDQRLNQSIPGDIVMNDELGNPVKVSDLLGKRPLLLAPIYFRCPMLCQTELSSMLVNLKVLKFTAGQEFDVVAFSFDPNETPVTATEKKEEYLRDYNRPGAAPGWHFLTGDAANIKRLTDAIGFHYVWDEKSRQFIHGSALLVVTPAGKISRYFYGVDYSSRDIQFGLMEASQERIGSVTDHALLFCYAYNPLTGKYGFAIMRVLQVAGALTILILGSFMFVMFRRDHAASRREKAAGPGDGAPDAPENAL